jgi:hypothetical protein
MAVARERKEFPPPKLHTLDDGECAEASHLTSKMKLGSNGKRRFRSAAKPAPVSAMNHCHERVRDMLGFPREFVPHSLRATFGIRLGENHVDVFAIQRRMGHCSITVSQRYVHPGPRLWRMRSWPKNGPAKNFANIGRQSPQISPQSKHRKESGSSKLLKTRFARVAKLADGQDLKGGGIYHK